MGRGAHALATMTMAVVVAMGGLAVTASPAAAAGTFQGTVDAAVSPAPGQLALSGWLYDEDAPTVSISYHVYVGGSGPGDPSSFGYALGPAALQRDDVGAFHPHAGPFHGFGAVLDVPIHGPQPVYVFAINVDGTPGPNALLWAGTVTIGNPPPQTTITSGPPQQGTAQTVSFGFAANEPASFTCRWDQGAWQACASPVSATIPVGAHTFAVYAVDAEGAADPTPAAYSFTVDPPPLPPVVAPPPAPTITLRVRAIRRKSRLRINIGPDLNPSNYTFVVQRRLGKKWRTVRRTQTLGPRDVSVIDLPRGTYRVVVPRQHGMAGTRATTRLRR